MNLSKKILVAGRCLIIKLIKPRKAEENRRRQELILNILLACSILFLIAINIIRIIDFFTQINDRGLPLIFTLLILAFFIWLYYLSRRGHLKTAAILFILIYSLPTFYFAYRWGADLPAALLLAVLIITISGVLIGSKLAFGNTLLIASVFLTLTFLQQKKILSLDSYWRQETNEVADMLAYLIILGIISIVAWLYAREIEKSLKRAHLSEQALKEERDQLEIKVEERTKQIRELEMEKITQLYRLAEFGRLSSGIFHDLINPLTAVALNLEELKKFSPTVGAISHLEQAFRATRKMENFIISIKKQIQGDKIKRYFSLKDEVEETRQILNHKIQKAQVKLSINIDADIKIYGDPLKFSQVIANLLSNAVEACEARADNINKEVNIDIRLQANKILIKIQDNGAGIKPEHQAKIWQAFFSTKTGVASGLGIGLASSKNIIEKDFLGTIEAESPETGGTIFTIELPRLVDEAIDKDVDETEKEETND